MRTRRGFLTAAGAAVAGLGGCLSSNESVETGSDGPTATPTGRRTTTERSAETRTRTRTRTRTETPTPTPRPTPSRLELGDTHERGGVSVGVAAEGHYHSLIYRISRRTADIGDAEGTQFLLLEVDATVPDGQGPAPEDFVLDDGEPVGRGWTRYDGFDAADAVFRGTAESFGDPYDPERGRGWIGFALPERFTVRDPRVVLTSGRRTVAEWSLPQELQERLERRPPEWEIESFSGPGTGGNDMIELSITNAGNHEGSFPVVVNYTGDVETFEAGRERVPAGQTRTWRTNYSYGAATNPDFEVRTPVRTFDFNN